MLLNTHFYYFKSFNLNFLQHSHYYVRIARFMPRVEIVHKHSTAARRLFVRGHNGKVLVITDIETTLKFTISSGFRSTPTWWWTTLVWRSHAVKSASCNSCACWTFSWANRRKLPGASSISPFHALWPSALKCDWSKTTLRLFLFWTSTNQWVSCCYGYHELMHIHAKFWCRISQISVPSQ